jgi:hypothetical protein
MTDHRRATPPHRHRRRRRRRPLPRCFPGARAQGSKRTDASLHETVRSLARLSGDALDTPRSKFAAWWVRSHGEVRLQVARLPLSSGGQVVGRRLVEAQCVVDMKSWWHIRYLARVRPPKCFEAAGERAPQMATSAERGGIGWRLGYGLRSITGSVVVGEDPSGSNSRPSSLRVCVGPRGPARAWCERRQPWVPTR